MISFVGAGPGNVDLITIRGRRLLEQADVVIYAGSLVSNEHLDFCKDNCQIYNSASMTLEEVIDVMIESVYKGLKVVRLHTGDPTIYGAIREQMDLLDIKKTRAYIVGKQMADMELVDIIGRGKDKKYTLRK